MTKKIVHLQIQRTSVEDEFVQTYFYNNIL